MFNWTSFESELEVLRQGITGGHQGFAPERMIFRDWLMWRDYELGFAHGRLALTGQNRGGKTSLLALILPLLDGDTSPQRIDPSSSRDRSIAFYLLGDDSSDPDNPEVFAYNARIGYLAIEFRHSTKGEFLTIGMGISAARSHPKKIKEWWGFILPTKRIGRGFEIRGHDRNCIGWRDLERLIEPLGGKVYTEHGKYRQAVNDQFFGMTSDQYNELSLMLGQARTPKISDKMGPDQVLIELKKCLPAVSDERFKQTAEVVWNIEEHQRNLENVDQLVDCIGELNERLFSLAQAIVQDAAYKLQSAFGSLGNIVKTLNHAREDEITTTNEITEITGRMEERTGRLTEIRARLQTLKSLNEADLPNQINVAQEEVDKGQIVMDGILQRLNNMPTMIESLNSEIIQLTDRFKTHAGYLSRQASRMAEQANDCGCNGLFIELGGVVDEIVTVSIEEPADYIDDIKPAGTFLDTSRELITKYLEMSEYLEVLQQVEDEMNELFKELEDLRFGHREVVNAERKAEDILVERRDTLISELHAWRSNSQKIDLPDYILAQVCGAINILQATPPEGVISLIVPIRNYVSRRSNELSNKVNELMRKAIQHNIEAENLNIKLVELSKSGIIPIRSLLRQNARMNSNIIPLYRWVRFKSNVSEEVAARVEAAVLESGLLDLLIVSGDQQLNIDAWAVPKPIDDKPTLLLILEPEEGAPIEVEQLLSSIGWGKEQGEHWIDSDGFWQHGLSRGNVADWEHEQGFIGEERRKEALNRNIKLLQQSIDEAQLKENMYIEEKALIDETIKGMSQELENLEQCSWQGLFEQLTETARCRDEVEKMRSLVEAKRHDFEQSEKRYQENESEYRIKLKELPEAVGLNRTEILSRITTIKNLAENLLDHISRYNLLYDLMQDYRTRCNDLEARRTELKILENDTESAKISLTSAQAKLNTLLEKLKDPESIRVNAEIIKLNSDEDYLKEEDANDSKRIIDLKGELTKAQTTISLCSPNEKRLREEVDARLDEFKITLHIHPRLSEYLEILQKSGPVSAAQKVSRVIEQSQIDVEIERCRDQVRAYLFQNMDLLGDYRPVQGLNNVLFNQNREEMSCSVLYEQLLSRKEQYKTLLVEEQQKLYQRILYHGLLDEIRRLIRQAREFTDRINEYLKRAKAADGEKLSLKFELCDKEEVTGAAIGELLESTDQGIEWLSDERRELIISLIQKEVERVRAKSEIGGTVLTYSEAIKQGLDYRNWYEYKLFGQKPNDNKVPIRNKGFGKRSNSAKAWALIVPSAAGVAARYDAARKTDAPRLITLDEAFAGFEAHHQAIYLRYLDDLNLQWVISCPDELPYNDNLSAAMAYRLSLEGNVHVTYPILWDGTIIKEPLADLGFGLGLI